MVHSYAKNKSVRNEISRSILLPFNTIHLIKGAHKTTSVKDRYSVLIELAHETMYA